MQNDPSATTSGHMHYTTGDFFIVDLKFIVQFDELGNTRKTRTVGAPT